jgi:hypothetical protein
MAKATNNLLKAEALRKTKVETTYEYVPIIGQILGLWRKKEAQRIGDTVELHINTPLEAYDRLLINGKEIYLPPHNRTED